MSISAPAPEGGPAPKWKLLVVGVAALLLADQWTKFLAVEHLAAVFARAVDLSLLGKIRGFYGHRHLQPFALAPFEVWGDFWRMAYAENPGSAFGLFRSLPPGVRFAFFGLVTVAVVAVVVRAFRRLPERDHVRQVALALVLAGALGNFVDRLARRYVIDFIDWGVRDLRWPTFNLADVLVVVGVGLLLLSERGRAATRLAARRPVTPSVQG